MSARKCSRITNVSPVLPRDDTPVPSRAVGAGAPAPSALLHDDTAGTGVQRSASQVDPSSAQTPPVKDDQDSPWKDALEIFFRQAIELMAPDLYAVIDWSVAPVFLDKELQAIEVPDGPPGAGRLYADKLVQVRHRDGADAWILVHVEVQGGDTGPQAITRIMHRMYRYRTRIEDRHETLNAQAGQPPPALFSLCVLVASRSGPTHLEYQTGFLGRGVRFSFPVVHLSQWLDRWNELESRARTNPFAVVIMAQLQALQHHGAQRLAPMVSLARMLYEYGYGRDQIRVLLRLIQWILRLPKDQESAYVTALGRIRQERKMSYVMIEERLAMEKGQAEGRVEGQADTLLRQMQHRFGPVGESIKQRLYSAEAKDLEAWSLNVLDATTLDDVFRD